MLPSEEVWLVLQLGLGFPNSSAKASNKVVRGLKVKITQSTSSNFWLRLVDRILPLATRPVIT